MEWYCTSLEVQVSILDSNLKISLEILGKLLYIFRKVDEFVFPAAIFTTKNETRNKIQIRINLTNTAYFTILITLKTKIMSRNIKKIIRSIVSTEPKLEF